MVKSFKHKDLEKLYVSGSTKGNQAKQAKRLRIQLATLDAAHFIEDLDIPGYRLHQLKGSLKGLWSIIVNANWCITFEFTDGNAYIVNDEDYH